MNCNTCSTSADTRKARQAHARATGHDLFIPTAATMARYEERLAEFAAAGPRTHYVSPLTIFINRAR